MRKSRFSGEQIVAILQEADRTSGAEAAKRHKVSKQTLYVWRKPFGGLPLSVNQSILVLNRSKRT